MVVKHTKGLARSDRVAIQVSKHLLAPLQPLVQEEHYGDALVRQVWLLPQRRLDGSAAVLPIVDDESGGHWYMQDTDPCALRPCADWLEPNVGIDRRRDRRKD